MQIDTELSVVTVDGNKLATITFAFEDQGGAEAIVDFEPDRVLLAETDSLTHYSMVDSEGFVYAKIKRSEEWTEAAMEAGYFVLSLRTPLGRSDLMGGRLLLVAFPFGNVIKDSGTFSVRKDDLASSNPETVLRERAAAALKRLPKRPASSN